jgi:hypothetical protein
MRQRSAMSPEPRPNQIRSLNLIRVFLGGRGQIEVVSDTVGVRHQCGRLGECSAVTPEGARG